MDIIRNDELEKLILNVIKEENIEQASHTAPVYSLPEILALKNITELRKLGRFLHIKYYSKIPKADLIAAIVESLQNENLLQDLLYIMDETEWHFFHETASSKQLHSDKVLVDYYQLPQHFGLLQCFYHQDKLCFVVSDEIKSVYKKLEKKGFPEEKRFRDLLNNYTIAAISLYGVISQDELVALINSQNQRQTSIDELFSVLLTYVHRDIGYCFWDEYIVDTEFQEDNFAGIPSLLAARQGKSRYAPPPKDFLAYSDWDYYEETPQIRALQQHLTGFIPDPDKVLDILDEIHDSCVAEVRMQEYFDLLDSVGVIFDDMEQANKTMQLIMDVQNNTRLWRNYGHTPKELLVERSNLIPFPSSHPTRNAKIGRNDPCPCGSGKKYKKCCGR